MEEPAAVWNTCEASFFLADEDVDEKSPPAVLSTSQLPGKSYQFMMSYLGSGESNGAQCCPANQLLFELVVNLRTTLLLHIAQRLGVSTTPDFAANATSNSEDIHYSSEDGWTTICEEN
ncbi:hypothetical protein HPP92_028781 [Vanilla planifolia]|uniref:Uncharacterized protein n=1 Tax=Vanilla planifolia TaxID=51239 RepID=A0A835U332_VANPL|nr:hypothetical protein HPP92_028781 [Vanilla planifolia]KAG0446570.1 hypothetical protein HPP92_028770 [Vanilla planifolia]